MKLNATFDKNGYLYNFAIIGTVDGGMDIDVPEEISEEDLMEKGSCFKYDSETQTLTFDDLKYEQWVKSMEAAALSAQYIPSPLQSVIEIGKMMLAQISKLKSDDKLRISGLYETWTPGAYEVGDVRNYSGQTWECFQTHDNSVYPDIKPNNAAWFTFWRPLHGKSPETARPFVPVQGAHDMYHTGEYAYFNEKLYKCVQDTAYSPEDYAQAWQEEE